MPLTASSQQRQILERFLDPVRDILTLEVASAIAGLRADSVTQERIEELARRHHEGQLSAEESDEYEALVSGANLMAVLQAKARSALERIRAS